LEADDCGVSKHHLATGSLVVVAVRGTASLPHTRLADLGDPHR